MSTVFASITTPGPPGPPGRTSLWLTGAGVPVSAQGLDGDMYLDSSTGNVYGPKVSNAWGPVVANIKGSPGAAGATGPAGYSPRYIVAAGAPTVGQGNDGDMYLDSTTSALYGPKAAGAWGASIGNIKGATGATGAQGPPGVAYTPRGAWSAVTTYVQGDMVSDAGIAYIALQSANTNHVPASSPTWWQAVASGGVQTPWASDINAATFNLTNVGRIGIGVTGVPAVPFHGVSAANFEMRLESGAGNAPFVSYKRGTQTWWLGPGINTDASFILYDQTRAAYVLSATTAGDIGIGATSPQTRLHIAKSNAGGIGPVIRLENSTGQLHDACAIEFWDANKRSELRFSVEAGPYGGDLMFFSDGSGATTERFRITSGGNVGINTNNPGSQLTVIPASTPSSVATSNQIAIGEATNNSAYRMSLGYGNLSGVSAGVIQVGSGGGPSPLLLNPSGGNVGIGTANPSALLSLSTANGVATTLDFTQATQARWTIAIPAGVGALAFSQQGSEFMRITNAGNVGIGTASPQGLFSINPAVYPTTLATANILTIGEPTNTAGFYLSLGYLLDSANWKGCIQARQSGGPTSLILNGLGGNVGVGTLNPIGKLHINAGTDQNLRVEPGSGGGGAAGAGISLRSLNDANNAVTPFVFQGRHILFNPASPDCYVGIGTLNPLEALVVTGAFRIGNGAIAANGFNFLQDSNGHLRVKYMNSATVFSDILTLTYDGKLGIGVGATPPTYPLVVAGDVNITGTYRVNGTPVTSGFTAQNVVTASRSLNTVYQNTTGKTMLVNMTSNLSTSTSLVGYSDSSSSPTQAVSNVGSSTSVMNGTISFVVLPGFYYKIATLAGSATLNLWIEWT